MRFALVAAVGVLVFLGVRTNNVARADGDRVMPWALLVTSYGAGGVPQANHRFEVPAAGAALPLQSTTWSCKLNPRIKSAAFGQQQSVSCEQENGSKLSVTSVCREEKGEPGHFSEFKVFDATGHDAYSWIQLACGAGTVVADLEPLAPSTRAPKLRRCIRAENGCETPGAATPRDGLIWQETTRPAEPASSRGA